MIYYLNLLTRKGYLYLLAHMLQRFWCMRRNWLTTCHFANPDIYKTWHPSAMLCPQLSEPRIILSCLFHKNLRQSAISWVMSCAATPDPHPHPPYSIMVSSDNARSASCTTRVVTCACSVSVSRPPATRAICRLQTRNLMEGPAGRGLAKSRFSYQFGRVGERAHANIQQKLIMGRNWKPGPLTPRGIKPFKQMFTEAGGGKTNVDVAKMCHGHLYRYDLFVDGEGDGLGRRSSGVPQGRSCSHLINKKIKSEHIIASKFIFHRTT